MNAPTPAADKTGILYATLDQRRPVDLHDADDPGYIEAIWSELADLYRGGYAIAENAKKYLPRLPNESDQRWAARQQAAAFVPYLGEIIDYFGAATFESNLVVTESADATDDRTPGVSPERAYWDVFAKDADLKGRDFSAIVQEALKTALLKRKALFAIDFRRRPDGLDVASRADEDRLGLARAYVYELPVEQLIDWEYDEDDVTTVRVGADDEQNAASVTVYGFRLAVIKRTVCRREGVTSSRAMAFDEFKVWTRRDGLPVWDLYRSEPYEVAKGPKKDAVCAHVDEGAATGMDAIPILELKVTDGLWMGNKIGLLNKEHWQRRSTLVSGENESLVQVPFYQLGEQIGGPSAAIPADVAQDQDRGSDPIAKMRAKGFLVGTDKDKFSFVAPDGGPYEVIDSQIDGVKEEMYRVVDRMAASLSNKASNVGRSGDSKAQDRANEVKILGALGKLVRDAARRIYTFISRARKEATVWTPHGCDTFEVDNRTELIAEVVAMASITIESPTFWRQYKKEKAIALLGSVEPEVAKTIKDELDRAITDESVLAPVTRDEPDGDEGDTGDDPTIDSTGDEKTKGNTNAAKPKSAGTK